MSRLQSKAEAMEREFASELQEMDTEEDDGATAHYDEYLQPCRWVSAVPSVRSSVRWAALYFLPRACAGPAFHPAFLAESLRLNFRV